MLACCAHLVDLFESFNPNSHGLLNDLFPTGGGVDSVRALGTLDNGLPFLPNCFYCKLVMKRRCAKCFYINRIRFIAFATKISSNIIYGLRQMSMHIKHIFKREKQNKISKNLVQNAS